MKAQQTYLRIFWLIICLPLFVVFLPQAIYVKRTTLRLPEAAGQRFKLVNANNPLRLIHVGESTVAGVGVDSIEKGFTANLALAISELKQRPISWALFGENGIRIKGLNQILPSELQNLDRQTEKEKGTSRYDLAVVTMGVNDSTKFTSIKQWKKSLKENVEILRAVTDGPIYFTQVPPLAQFPALPSPLKNLLGIRSQILDNELKQFCELQLNVYYIGSEMQVGEGMMAIDGYHPSELGYQRWAQTIAAQITHL